MSSADRTLVQQQVRRVQRRLFGQTLLRHLLTGWSVALFLAAGWFLLRPFFFVGLGDTVRWAVPAAFLGVATLAAIVLAVLRAPKAVTAALALDERFTLKERVTTLLSLRPEQTESAAGQALLQDITARVQDLRVADRFALTLPWTQALVPLGALVLVLGAGVFDPYLSRLKFGSRPGPAVLTYDARDIQQQLDKLHEVSARRSAEQPRSPELKDLEEEWDKLIQRPLDLNNPEKMREHTSELRKLDDKIKERLDQFKDKTEKTDQLKKELEKLAATAGQLKEGPAKDFENALAQGKFKKAEEVLQKLRKQLKEQALSPDQQKELAKQLKQVQDKLQKLLNDSEQRKHLKQLEELAKSEKDTPLDREEIQRQLEPFKDLQDLADALADAAGGLNAGDGEAAEDALGRVSGRFDNIELSEAEFNDLLSRQRELDEEMDLLMQACRGQCPGNGLGQGRFPGGIRPIDPNDPLGAVMNQRQKAEVDPKGRQRITGFVRGGTFTKVPARAVAGTFQQAAQEAPGALDRQRIPEDAAAVARGYFKQLGEQK